MSKFVTTTTNGKIKVTSQDEPLRLFAIFVTNQYSSWCALFQLITGIKPPKLRDLLRLYG